MLEKIKYTSKNHNLSRISRVFDLVHPKNRGSRKFLLSAIAYELNRAQLKYKPGSEVSLNVDFHVYDPFLADIVVGTSNVTTKLLIKFPPYPSEDNQTLSVIVLQKQGSIPVRHLKTVDMIYTYGENHDENNGDG